MELWIVFPLFLGLAVGQLSQANCPSLYARHWLNSDIGRFELDTNLTVDPALGTFLVAVNGTVGPSQGIYYTFDIVPTADDNASNMRKCSKQGGPNATCLLNATKSEGLAFVTLTLHQPVGNNINIQYDLLDVGYKYWNLPESSGVLDHCVRHTMNNSMSCCMCCSSESFQQECLIAPTTQAPTTITTTTTLPTKASALADSPTTLSTSVEENAAASGGYSTVAMVAFGFAFVAVGAVLGLLWWRKREQRMRSRVQLIPYQPPEQQPL